MTTPYFTLSPEFAQYLKEKGQLDALVFALKEFKTQQNFPFEKKDKNIIKLALMKGYSELLGKLSFSGEPQKIKKEFLVMKEFLLEEIEKDAERIYGESGQTKVRREIVEAIQRSPEGKKAKKDISLKDYKEALEEGEKKNANLI